MLNLGATYVNAQNFFDGSTPPVLVDPTTVAVSITRPDLTTTPVTPVRVSTGLYTATYIPTQAGRHLINWTASA